MKDFVDGLFVKRPRENAPEFVKGSILILVDKFIPYLKSKANANGYVNLDLLESKDGNLYAKLNEWKPTGNAVQHETKEDETINFPGDDEEIRVENVPF
jgi:hypothetical protein